ncbi:MAG TPA: hypothetical protein VKB86_22295 [Pyrinomonadaceae bacterium]|nr:hypothetical protein [Pyrinomonadaceae bacterium]
MMKILLVMSMIVLVGCQSKSNPQVLTVEQAQKAVDAYIKYVQNPTDSTETKFDVQGRFTVKELKADVADPDVTKAMLQLENVQWFHKGLGGDIIKQQCGNDGEALFMHEKGGPWKLLEVGCPLGKTFIYIFGVQNSPIKVE